MDSKKKDFMIMLFLLCGDALLISINFVCVYLFRFYTVFPIYKGIPEFSAYLKAIPAATFVWMLIFAHYGLYNISNIESRWNQAGNVTRAVLWGAVALLAASTLYRAFQYSTLVIVISGVSSIIIINLYRFLISHIRIRMLEKLHEKKRILIIGTGDTASRLAVTFRDSPQYVSNVIGFLTTHPEMVGSEIMGFKVIDTLENMDKYFSRKIVDEMILTLSTLSHEKIVDFIVKCSKELVSWKMIPDIMQMTVARLGLEEINGIPIMRQKELPLDYVGNRILKRVFDIAGSLIGVMVFLLVTPVLGIIIKTTSKGPLLYKQQRVGEDGKVFTLFKFRSMRSGAEDETGPVWAKKNDERRTPIGCFMRRYNIDELPQFWNVLKGNMSLVGPRPERPHFVYKFKEQIPYYMARHRVKSGITGWAQISGYRGDTSITGRTKYDIYYMENWSLMFDLRIVIMTFASFKNAY